MTTSKVTLHTFIRSTEGRYRNSSIILGKLPPQRIEWRLGHGVEAPSGMLAYILDYRNCSVFLGLSNEVFLWEEQQSECS